METNEKFFENICRVCLSCSRREDMWDLFDKSSEDGLNCYGKSLEIMCDILVKSDGLPGKMCKECLLRLKQAILLKKTCENSQEVLRKLTDNFSLQSDLMKQNVTEFVLFKTYFPEEQLSNDSECENNDDQNKNHTKISVKTPKYVNESSQDIYPDGELHSEDSSNNIIDKKPIQSSNECTSIDDLLNTMENIINTNSKTLNNFISVGSKIKPKKNSNKKNVFKRKLIANKKEPQRFICTICNKSFISQGSLMWHKEKYCDRQSIQYICEICGKIFAANALLQRHQAYMHSVGKLYPCNQCEFKASRQFELTEHMRHHTGERPFACDKCGLTFRRRYIWKKHALYHEEKTVRCPQCPRKFYRKAEMMGHYNNIHERLNLYKCSECDVTYAKPSTVRRHLVEKHGVPREEQGRILRIKIGKPSINI